MKIQRWRWGWLLLWLMHCSAFAHTKSESHSVWRIDGKSIQVTYTLPLLESARLAHAPEEQPSDEQLLVYLRQHLSISNAQSACTADAARALAAAAQYRRFEFRFTCLNADALSLHSSAFFELAPSHVNFAQIQTGEGQMIEQLFDENHQTVLLSRSDANMRDASLFDYLRLGVMHILTGPDHMSFLLGLVLISRRLRDLIFVVTGFTIGHSVTLALAVTGIVRPHAQYIDALVALTIAMIGAENIAIAAQRSGTVAAGMGLTLATMAACSLFGIGSLPPLLLLGAALFCSNYLMLAGHLRDAGRLRLVATLVFGLIHGFGFAAGLLEMQLPAAKLLQILFGFNLGVEIGQLILVLAVIGLVALLARMRMTLPRPLVVDALGAGLVAVGTYWFVSRSYV